MFYNPVDNHFATLIVNDELETHLYDITGRIDLTSDWQSWESYSKEDYLEAERITQQCIYKIYEHE